MLKIEKITNKHEVYDITVSITNNFYANGILVHN
jgi:intein/homing endonuclease